MKLRLRGDSLRCRLTQSEVITLAEQGAFEDATHFALGHQKLVYRLETTADATADATTYATRLTAGDAGRIEVTVILPAQVVKQWAATQEVGLYFTEPWGLKVAVEKDFRCLDPNRDEDESDNFENPLAEHGHDRACEG